MLRGDALLANKQPRCYAGLLENFSDPISLTPQGRIEAIHDTGNAYGKVAGMSTARKVTVQVPVDLLERAQRASGTGVTQTIRAGLQLVAASQAYAGLRRLRGKIRFSRTAAELKTDR